MIDASLYYPICLFTTLFLIAIESMQVYGYSDLQLVEEKRGSKMVLLYALFFIFFVGLRPLSWEYFGDTVNYARVYSAYQYGYRDIVEGTDGDWLFDRIMYFCSQRMDVHQFFLIIEACYIIPMVVACRRFFPNNSAIALLFCFSAFSFFTYGVNGIRNGMATSIVILILTLNETKKEHILALILSFIAISIHKSMMLPLLMMYVSYFYKNTKMVLWVWCGSIVISLVAGAVMENFFAGLGFDDRLEEYINSDENDDEFSSTGFRFDFLLYSMMPIILGYYTVIKRGLSDRNYLLMLHAYILSNAFWVMLIRASFSNRFAYLSWFLYPIVLAYPLLKLRVWGDQGKWCAWILLAHFGFTFLMWLR